ncbi:hypothetical protein FJT64_007157 [Amphibalanus amphitrite]|uniref:Uncharacterized protein n=1 Tax=Amphibalanus amphitrite TaxID=1232801 RepID=A0A6A4VL95_AMPAM|nr:hypothetical protein FJT64_007157 [Amphibalanus amphitrite]
MSTISREFHEFGKGIASRLAVMEGRIRDLERHVEEKDNEIEDLTSELRDTRDETEVEDINGLVIGVIRARLRGLDISEEDVDRAHRLPGQNNRIIVRFVRSGPNSVRDQLMSRRMELKHHNDLFVNESLTQKNVLYRSLLDANKARRSTQFSQGGDMYISKPKNLALARA